MFTALGEVSEGSPGAAPARFVAEQAKLIPRGFAFYLWAFPIMDTYELLFQTFMIIYPRQN